jgi:AraC-like DNA-binding protein
MHNEVMSSAFQIQEMDLSVWEKRPHTHSFFEIVYIKEGKGKQCVNKNLIEYTKDNVFLLPPLNCHSFQIEERTQFVFIQFSEAVFQSFSQFNIDYKDWFNKIAYILVNYNRKPGDLIQSSSEKTHLIHLIQFLLFESKQNDKHSAFVYANTLASILSILTRNVEKVFVTTNHYKDSKFNELLNYIQHHLFENDKIRLKHLAEQFAISPSYFAEYFKKNAGQSLQDYVLSSKVKIAEAKFLQTDLSVKEVADQLSFTDASHLSRTFQKFNHVSIKQFKQEGQFRLLKS